MQKNKKVLRKFLILIYLAYTNYSKFNLYIILNSNVATNLMSFKTDVLKNNYDRKGCFSVYKRNSKDKSQTLIRKTSAKKMINWHNFFICLKNIYKDK